MLNPKKETKNTYDKIANLWKEYRGKPDKEIISFVPTLKNKNILDVGCGTGRYLKSLGDNYVVEMDFSLNMLKLNPHSIKVKADVLDLPFKEESFDFVLGVAVLHHLSKTDLKEAFRSIKRVMKSGSKGIFTFWCREEFQKKGSVNIKWDKNKKSYPRYYYFYSMSELKSVVSEIGFSETKLYFDNKKRNIVLEVIK